MLSLPQFKPAFAMILALAGVGVADAREGIAAADWSGIRAAYERSRHSAVKTGDEYRARNPGQQWTTRFDGRGFLVQADDAGWAWGLQLDSYGFASNARGVSGSASVKADGQRVKYGWGGGVEEWFVNDRRGLEHGFTFDQRPAKSGGPLVVQMGVRGGLQPLVQADGQGIHFVDNHGQTLLTYAGLKVWDADGKQLPARLATSAGGLRIEVEEHAARYPIMIDPFVRQAYLKASNTDSNDWFGYSVAISEDTVVVGAPMESSSATTVNGDDGNNTAAGAGAAYVFVRNGATWSQQAYLKASNAQASDNFGISVAISGDTIVVGATGEASNAKGVGGNQNDNTAAFSGAAYVFVRTGTTWSQQAYLKASNTDAGDEFGISVGVSGERLVVGARAESSNATGVNGDDTNNSRSGSGAAYVFVRNSGSWSQEAYLKALNTGSNDRFGGSVAISGDNIVVGADFEDSGAKGVNGDGSDTSSIAFDSGAAYIFVRSSGVWSQQAYLKPSNTDPNDSFGASVAVSGNTVVVGAPDEDSSAKKVNGAQGNNAASSSGAAYVFVGQGSSWNQQAYLKASNSEADDQFGRSVAVSEDTIVVGAVGEDSSGPPNNNTVESSGAAYVFQRTGNTWTEEAYLKGSNVTLGDRFGFSAAATEDTAVIGAFAEDSNATGVNGNEADNSAADAGAAYVFFSQCVFDPELTLSPEVLSPADHRMVEIKADVKVDRCVKGARVRLLGVTSSDPDSGTSAGDKANDIQEALKGKDDRKFLLRAERVPPGTSRAPRIIDSNTPPGRTYTVTYEVSVDRQVKRAEATVRVP